MVPSELTNALQTALQLEKCPPTKYQPIDAVLNINDKTEWRSIGLAALSQGKLAVITMAGGQGTRLGSSSPKGCYLINNQSLFQMQADRINKIAIKVNKPINWAIMTSPQTHAETIEYFDENGYFSMDKEFIHFFKQSQIPAFREDNEQELMDTDQSPIMSPNGNGGMFEALRTSGLLQTLTDRGVEGVHVLSIDNVLARPADPAFLGYCLSRNVQTGVKCVKRLSGEKTGVFATDQTGRLAVAEYSELPSAMVCCDQFMYANIANHYFAISFLRQIDIGALPVHIARKQIKLKNGECVKGMKMELFVFDALKQADCTGIVCVDRLTEFAPLKNKDGVDSPQTCEMALKEYYSDDWI